MEIITHRSLSSNENYKSITSVRRHAEEQVDLEDQINPLRTNAFKYPAAVTMKSERSASKSQSFNKVLKTENCGERGETEMLISNQQTSYSPPMPKFDLNLRIKRREEPMPDIINKNQYKNSQTI